ncbi:MAG TPA: hypothetical protein VKB87_16945 [Myxococcaceae bacterium]|nr:hypothetical protein [Myxococcaceae bacterium]
MSLQRIWAAVPIALAALAEPAHAQGEGDDELSRIPSEAPPAPPAAPSGRSRLGKTVYVESATEAELLRSSFDVPPPSPTPTTIEQRLFVDAVLHWIPIRDLTFHLSARAGLRAGEDIAFPTHENIRVDFRELYASWKVFEGAYLDAGRINLKSGVAIGFNPTDFFKTRAVVEPLSVDPSVLREDRLGTLMLRGQFVWKHGSVSAAFAPRVASPPPLYTSAALPALDPMFGRTNAHHRFLLKANVDLIEDFSPEALFYQEDGAVRLGFNIAQSLGKKVVAYAEWAGGSQSGLSQEALAFGTLTKSFSTAVADNLATSSATHFQQDASVGLSYANESKMTFWLEYHLHQAGFSRGDWRFWFDQGTGPSGELLSPLLWFERGYAQEQQAPMSKHSLFLRADWADAFIFNLELTAFANVDLYDGSTLAQVTASYAVTNLWTVALLSAANVGSRRSEFGSLPGAFSALFTIRYYF